MLTTQFAGGLRARPLEARPDRGSGLIFFVTDIHSAKEDEIKIASDIGLVSIDAKDKAYLSITGRAIRDPEKIKAALGEKAMRFGGRRVRPVPRYACYGSNLSRRNCGTDRRALPYLPSSLPSQN